MSSFEGRGIALHHSKSACRAGATIALPLLLTFVVGRIERLLTPWRRIQ
jgi:hypothetical protein